MTLISNGNRNRTEALLPASRPIISFAYAWIEAYNPFRHWNEKRGNGDEQRVGQRYYRVYHVGGSPALLEIV